MRPGQQQRVPAPVAAGPEPGRFPPGLRPYGRRLARFQSGEGHRPEDRQQPP